MTEGRSPELVIATRAFIEARDRVGKINTAYVERKLEEQNPARGLLRKLPVVRRRRMKSAQQTALDEIEARNMALSEARLSEGIFVNDSGAHIISGIGDPYRYTFRSYRQIDGETVTLIETKPARNAKDKIVYRSKVSRDPCWAMAARPATPLELIATARKLDQLADDLARSMTQR